MSDSKSWSVPIVGYAAVLVLLGVGSYVYDKKEVQPAPVVRTMLYSEEARASVALARADWTLDCIAEQKEGSVWRDNPAHLNKCVADAAKIYYVQELPDADR